MQIVNFVPSLESRPSLSPAQKNEKRGETEKNALIFTRGGGGLTLSQPFNLQQTCALLSHRVVPVWV